MNRSQGRRHRKGEGKYKAQFDKTVENKIRREEKWKRDRERWANDKEYQKRQERRRIRLGRL